MVKRDGKYFWLVSGYLLLSGIGLIILGIYDIHLAQELVRSLKYLQSLGLPEPAQDLSPNYTLSILTLLAGTVFIALSLNYDFLVRVRNRIRQRIMPYEVQELPLTPGQPASNTAAPDEPMTQN